MNLDRSTMFKDRVFVFAGRLRRITRQRATRVLESRGAHVRQSVSNLTDYLVAGENPGTRLEQAQIRGVSVLAEQDFVNLIMGRAVTTQALAPTSQATRSAPARKATGRPGLNEALTQLRALVYDLEAPDAWGNICKHLETLQELDLAMALHYLGPLLGQAPAPPDPEETDSREIPASTRLVAPEAWVARTLASQTEPRLHLARAVRYTSKNLNGKIATAMIKSQDLRQIQDLDLHNNPLSATFLKALGQAPGWDTLRRLNLAGVVCGPKAIAGLQGPSLRGLTHLNLCATQLHKKAAVKTLGQSQWPDLTWLRLSENGLTLHDLRLLAPLMTSVRHLDLSSNHLLGGTIVDWLGGQAPPHRLQSLRLSFNDLEEADLEAMGQQASLGNLHVLHLEGAYQAMVLSVEAMRHLTRSPHLTQLTTLNLAQTYPSEAALSALTQAEGFRHLRHLDLSNNRLGSKQATRLLDAPWSAKLHSLKLRSNPLTRTFVRALGQADQMQLEALDLSDMPLMASMIEAADLVQLLGAPSMRALRKFWLPPRLSAQAFADLLAVPDLCDELKLHIKSQSPW